MANEVLIQSVGLYIEKYYVPGSDDIKLDQEMLSVFNRISDFRRKKQEARKKRAEEPVSAAEFEIVENENQSFDVASMQETKMMQPMSSSMTTKRRIDDLIDQMEETFSQRLLRMIDERDMTDSEAYTKAHVDRRHFSKIRKDVNYTPNKKTVLAFSIALELSLDETKDLLGAAGYALSRSSKTDIIVAYFLQNHIYDMFEINDVLYAYEQPIFE